MFLPWLSPFITTTWYYYSFNSIVDRLLSGPLALAFQLRPFNSIVDRLKKSGLITSRWIYTTFNSIVDRQPPPGSGGRALSLHGLSILQQIDSVSNHILCIPCIYIFQFYSRSTVIVQRVHLNILRELSILQQIDYEGFDSLEDLNGLFFQFYSRSTILRNISTKQPITLSILQQIDGEKRTSISRFGSIFQFYSRSTSSSCPQFC